MCGICGEYSAEVGANPGRARAVIARLTADMTRRGPDDAGYWSDDTHCALGFRRLAILDLSPAGHQPMVTSDGRYALVYNGELYNFRDLRSELASRGHRFRSTGDTEVVLAAIAEWGAGALERFNGMYALGLYDAVERSLLLARDHAGIKPLYYLRSSRGVVFASQYDQILHHPWAAGASPSRDGLALYLRFGFVPAPYGLMEGTHQVEAGTWVRFLRDGSVERGTSFEFPRFVEPTLRGDGADEALDEALARAVSRQLVADVPVGVFLSGGIDSPLVAAEAVRAKGRLAAFTIATDDPASDESDSALAYAEELGVAPVVGRASANAALDLVADVVDACGEPTGDFSIFPTLLVSRLAARDVKVVLSGDGGDELFWGYPQRFGTVLDQAPYFEAGRARRAVHVGMRRVFGRGRATRDVLWPTIGDLYRRKHTLFPEADLARALGDAPSLPESFDLFDYAGSDADETAQFLRWNEYRLHLARVLLKVDRASMFSSIEVRVPLLDRDVIDVASRCDWRDCLDLGTRTGKRILRRALRRRLRHETPGKRGFTVPMHSWLVGSLRDVFREHVLARRELLGLDVNAEHLERMLRRMEAGERGLAWPLWQLLSLSLWKERHLAARAVVAA